MSKMGDRIRDHAFNEEIIANIIIEDCVKELLFFKELNAKRIGKHEVKTDKKFIGISKGIKNTG